ncbi:MAG TPA: aminoglycoside phosphotransferase family protein [Pseudonocardiaceae bacterium]|nr:aminoglycoside phosphotransferase family protein [Pseudonocardiaceae bacterium]
MDLSSTPDPALAGAYNLPGGRVPVIAGKRHWPWDDEVAQQRLEHLARLLGITLSGNESRLAGASNDTWLIGGKVLRVCWRGDLDRMRREAELAAALPPETGCPRPIEVGRDERFSWMLVPRVRGATLSEIWPTTPQPLLRDYVAQLANLLDTIHAWQPPEHIRAMITAAAPTETDDALAITGKQLIPSTLWQQLRLVDYARSLPFADAGLLAAIADRLIELDSRQASEPAAEPRFLHCDATPGNVLVHEGRITALLDYEWACFGPLDLEPVLPMFWVRCQPADARAGRLIDWLRVDCPALFAAPDLAERHWRSLAAFALRCLVHWPPSTPEQQLEPDHPLLLLRELAGARLPR